MDIPHPIVAFLQVGMPCRAWSLFRATKLVPFYRFAVPVFRAIWALLTMRLVAWSVNDIGLILTDERTLIGLIAGLLRAVFSVELGVLLIRFVVSIFPEGFGGAPARGDSSSRRADRSL